MTDPGPTPQAVVLLVGLSGRTATALDMVLSGLGLGVIDAPTVRVARRALAASSAMCSVMCRCSETEDDGLGSFAAWLGAEYPALGLRCVCNTPPAHDHTLVPRWCQVPIPPFGAADVAKAIAKARLDAFAQAH